MDILTEREGSLLTIIFNRPQKRNAITAAMYQALADALQEAESDRGVRVILIQGQPQIFTSGNDLKDFLTCPPTGSDASVFQFMHRISQASKPIVAAVSGAAVGIGTTMLLHCDLVYAADNATFAMPFVRLGLCPEIASSLLLPQLVGYQRAAEKLLLGEPFRSKRGTGDRTRQPRGACYRPPQRGACPGNGVDSIAGVGATRDQATDESWAKCFGYISHRRRSGSVS